MLRALMAAAVLLCPAASPVAGPPAMAAVGVLKFGRGACSGTLIAPDLVLTAGHCVLRPDRGGVASPRRVWFHTGAYPGFDSRKFKASDVVVHPFYIGGDEGDVARLRHDGGLVRLAEPVPLEVARPIPVVEPDPDAPTFLASYRGGRGVRARERRCPILVAWEGLVSLSCDVRPGESGSPIIVEAGGELGLVGIVAASSRVRRTEVALAAPASELLGGLKAMMGGF